MKAIRMGRWKGIISDIRNGDQTMELFDLEKDVTETTNVASEHPEIVRQLHQLMDEARVQSDHPSFNF
jgi:arylsulfatase